MPGAQRSFLRAPELPPRFCQWHHVAAGSRAEIKMFYCHTVERSVSTPGLMGLGGFSGLHVAISVPNQPELCAAGRGSCSPAAHSSASVSWLQIMQTPCSISSWDFTQSRAGRATKQSRQQAGSTLCPIIEPSNHLGWRRPRRRPSPAQVGTPPALDSSELCWCAAPYNTQTPIPQQHQH